MLLRRISVAALFAVLTGWPSAAVAAPITVVTATSFVVNFDGNVEGVQVAGLQGSARFDFLGFFDENHDGDTEAKFNVALTNTTLGPLSSRISFLGFNTAPEVIGGDADGAFETLVWDGKLKFPNGFGTIDLCVSDDQVNNCSGGGDGGVSNPNTGFFSLALIFDGTISSLTLDGFGVRYQSIEGGGFSDDSGTGRGTPTEVPEPASILLLGAGLAAVLARRSSTDLR